LCTSGALEHKQNLGIARSGTQHLDAATRNIATQWGALRRCVLRDFGAGLGPNRPLIKAKIPMTEPLGFLPLSIWTS
jgi:hypothetical protein